MKGVYDDATHRTNIKMITNVNKKVICVKDIPSNIIEEAIFILKTDAMVTQSAKRQKQRREIAAKEAETFLKDYIFQIQKDVDENHEKRIFKKLKFKIVLATFAIIAVCYILALII